MAGVRFPAWELLIFFFFSVFLLIIISSLVVSCVCVCEGTESIPTASTTATVASTQQQSDLQLLEEVLEKARKIRIGKHQPAKRSEKKSERSLRKAEAVYKPVSKVSNPRKSSPTARHSQPLPPPPPRAFVARRPARTRCVRCQGPVTDLSLVVCS